MAPRWPQVDIGPEHIKEHATYLKEACNQLQAVDKGRQNQVPWNTVQQYLASTIALIGKVLRQPAMGEILRQVQDAAKCTQNMQKDITIIKNSVGLNTTPQTTANTTGGRSISWAQVAAQAPKGTALPPPVPQGMAASKTQSTVTAYKDRVVTVKLKDHGIAQRYRNQIPSWARQQVETAIRGNASTRAIKVVAAHQLKSGDIQIFTSSTAEAAKLKEDKGWLRALGENAEVIVPTYGVIVHGIYTSSINIKDQRATIQQMLADNYTDDHTAWSNACPAKRKEMQRVDQAKESRSIYWHVPLTETKRTRDNIISQQNQSRQPAPPQTATQRLEDNPEPRRLTDNASLDPRPPLTQGGSIEAPTTFEPLMPTQSPAAPSIEDWETPATQKNHEQRDPVSDLVDPLLMATNALHDGNSAPNHRPQTSVYPLEGLEEAAMQDADEWLQSMANNDDNEWPFVPQADEASPITSVATDTRTARGIIFKGCRCTSHQDTYSDWPVQDAELTIAKYRSSTPRTYEKNIREKKPYNIPRQQGEMEYSKPRLDPQTPHGVSPATASSPTDQ
ncbi:hypothetical protein E5D57_000220 [Metarhizium anisopliae]|nr:hypothetical protein E5D57_000220 [Metarhizium anisopliae]